MYWTCCRNLWGSVQQISKLELVLYPATIDLPTIGFSFKFSRWYKNEEFWISYCSNFKVEILTLVFGINHSFCLWCCNKSRWHLCIPLHNFTCFWSKRIYRERNSPEFFHEETHFVVHSLSKIFKFGKKRFSILKILFLEWILSRERAL